MRYFADYLVEKKIVNADQMVSALIRQSQSLPSIAEIIHAQKLIAPEDLIEIFKTQNEKKISFQEAANDLGFWSNEIQDQLSRFISAAKTPLVKILEEMELVKPDTLSRAFDEFLGDTQTKQLTESQPVEKKQVLKSDYSGYLSEFNEDKANLLKQSFEQLKTGGVSISILNSIKPVLDQLSSAADAATAKESWSVLCSMNAIIEQLGKIPATSLNDEMIAKVGKVNLEAVTLLEKFKIVLATGKTETEAIQSDPELKKTYEMVSGGVELTRFDLDFLI